MKKWIFIVCLTMLFKPVMPVLDYIVNYEYVSTVLCINKAAPAMHCNGKCHLMKELAKAAESEKPLSQDKKHATTEITDLFIPEDYTFSLPAFYPSLKTQLNYMYTSRSYTSATSPIFRPPIFIA